MLHRNVRQVGWLAAAALGTLLGACSDNTTGTPNGPPAAVPAFTIEVVSQPTSGPVGEALPEPVVVRLKNPDGSIAAGERVTFTTANGGLVENSSATTDGDGLANSGEWVLGRAAGNQRLVAAASAANVGIDVTAEPAALAQVNTPAGMENKAFVAGLATSQEPIFIAVDSFDNRVGAGTEVTFTALEGSLETSPVTVETDANGGASPGAWTLSNIIGPQRIQADYEVDGVPTTTILTVEAVCSTSPIGPSSSVQGQWRSGNCRTPTQRITEYSLITPPVGGLPEISAFGLSLQGASGQAINLLASGQFVQATPPAYLYSGANPYEVNYIISAGNYNARALSPGLSDGVFTLSRSGSLDQNLNLLGEPLTYPTLYPAGCAEVGDVPWYTNRLSIFYGYIDDPNSCNAGGFGVMQDRFLIQLEAGDTLNPTVVNFSGAIGLPSANTLSLRIRDASTAGGPVLATGVVAGTGSSNYANPDLGTATNPNTIFIGTVNGVNAFVAPATGLYEIIIGTSAAGKWYQLLLSPPVHITTTSLPAATVGVAYSAGLAGVGGQGTLNFSVAAGALPPGFAMTAAGVISSANPAAAGTFNFTASLFAGSIAQQAYTLTINPAP